MGAASTAAAAAAAWGAGTADAAGAAGAAAGFPPTISSLPSKLACGGTCGAGLVAGSAGLAAWAVSAGLTAAMGVPGLTALREGISIAISTGTGLGWLSNKRGKPITPISTRTAAPISRWRARCRTTSTLSEAAAAAAGLAGDVRLRRKLKNDMGNAC